MSVTIKEAAAQILTQAADLLSEKCAQGGADRRMVIVAIDGRCGSGKSTLGEYLKESAGVQLIHMDDYYLRPEQRTEKRYQTPGENVDHERFKEEVLEPLDKGASGLYRPYRFHEKRFLESCEVKPEGIIVIEGSYSHHPELSGYYDVKVFLDESKETQEARIRKRGGDAVWEMFRDRWIPLEELYFDACRVREQAGIVLVVQE